MCVPVSYTHLDVYKRQSRKFMDDLDGLVDSVLETGKEQVTKYEFKQVVQEASDDGI